MKKIILTLAILIGCMPYINAFSINKNNGNDTFNTSLFYNNKHFILMADSTLLFFNDEKMVLSSSSEQLIVGNKKYTNSQVLLAFNGKEIFYSTSDYTIFLKSVFKGRITKLSGIANNDLASKNGGLKTQKIIRYVKDYDFRNVMTYKIENFKKMVSDDPSIVAKMQKAGDNHQAWKKAILPTIVGFILSLGGLVVSLAAGLVVGATLIAGLAMLVVGLILWLIIGKALRKKVNTKLNMDDIAKEYNMKNP